MGNLKGLILSGGKGSRLRPFTYTNAKQLVPIANKPVLFYAIEQMVECGISDIGIVVGEMGEQIRAAAGDGSAFGARIQYLRQEAPLGIAHAVKVARDFLEEAPFVLYLGDNLVQGGIKDFVESFRTSGSNCQILLHAVKNPQDFGVAQFVNGRVARVVEKPAEPPSNLAVIGVYMFDRHVFEAVEALRPSARGELEIADTIQYFIDRGLQVDAQILERYWIDTGKMEDILEANRIVLETLPPRRQGFVDEQSRLYEPITLEEGARIVNSVVRGPSIIGAESEIVDCYVGPFTAINHHCQLRGVRISGSVVMEHTVIEDIAWSIEDSLIGRYATLKGGQAVPDRYSLTLGDHSQIRMPEG